MEIQVPTTKKKFRPSDCPKRALMAHLNRKWGFGIDGHEAFQIQVQEEYAYYPFWIGIVRTQKERALPIYPVKEIRYYTVADAMSGDFIVLRNIPPLTNLAVSGEAVIPAQITEEAFETEILDEAIEERINKQFIFGKPYAQKERRWMIYVPMVKIGISRNGDETRKDYYVNVFTGEVKAKAANF